MNARDSTPPSGENVTGESYPQYCLNCSSEWQLLGDLDGRHRECPGCQLEAPPSTFLKWYVEEHHGERCEVEIEVSPEMSRAVDLLAAETDSRRDDLLADLFPPQPVYVVRGDDE